MSYSCWNHFGLSHDAQGRLDDATKELVEAQNAVREAEAFLTIVKEAEAKGTAWRTGTPPSYPFFFRDDRKNCDWYNRNTVYLITGQLDWWGEWDDEGPGAHVEYWM